MCACQLQCVVPHRYHLRLQSLAHLLYVNNIKFLDKMRFTEDLSMFLLLLVTLITKTPILSNVKYYYPLLIVQTKVNVRNLNYQEGM